MTSIIKRMAVGGASLAVAIMLAGCGQGTTSDTSSHSSLAANSSEDQSTKAYRAANRLIKSKDYQGAYEKLTSVNNRSKKADNLTTDLQNYLAAQDSYNNGDYDKAANNLRSIKSSSPAMRKAYVALQNQITSAQKSDNSSNASSSNSNSESSSATENSSVTSAANQTADSQTSSVVVVKFANKMGFSGSKGYEIIPTAKNGNVYRFEVRQSNEDNTVANLVGIYQYNSQTDTVTKLS